MQRRGGLISYSLRPRARGERGSPSTDGLAKRGAVGWLEFPRLLEVAKAMRHGILAILIGLISAGLILGCESSQKPQARKVTPVVRDVAPALRGTVGSESSLRNTEPVLVSGYGLVVGLQGTGGQTLDDGIAALMEREIQLRDISAANEYKWAAVDRVTPRQLLKDKNVAVVMVQGMVAPGAPRGMHFDVSVRAINASSLEGGRLWTTDLQLGQMKPMGGPKGKVVAEAYGPVFINPFSDPGKEGAGVTATVGRVLGGGVMTAPMSLEIVLDNNFHTRAKAMTSAINSRFPEETPERQPVARGRSGQIIDLSIPEADRANPTEFLTLVQYVQIDGPIERYAQRYVEAVKSEPFLATQLSYCMEALGQQALPIIRELYDYNEVVPRLAALRAGASLGDPLAAQALIKLAKEGAGAERLDAIMLLGKVNAGPTIDLALRDLLNEKPLLVRITAYEALAGRAERARFNRLMREQMTNPDPNAVRMNPSQLQVLAESEIPMGSIQGVSRKRMIDGFLLDRVQGGEGLVYITQQGTPRIVVFGSDPKLMQPIFATAWQDRLMLNCTESSGPIRVFYRDWKTGSITTEDVGPDLVKLIEFFAHKPSPEDPRPGLGMSYSEVVGALYAIHKAGGMNCNFATERDRLMAALNAGSAGQRKERPETTKDRPEVVVLESPQATLAPREDQGLKPIVVPIPREPKKK
ncbi:MAG: flagellar basal body P-ring protein FlgI [Phycisphaerales bacterium]|nr:flagellar basal body P-ring protein FlgI [Planctomycetota bacterium]